MEKEHLHLLIHEEIYRLPEDKIIPLQRVERLTTDKVQETGTETMLMAESVPEYGTESKEEKEEIQLENKEESQPDSPPIPKQKEEELIKIPFAVFHSSIVPTEHEFLQKIIHACNIPKDNYKIFANGFDQSVKFKKALVFIPKAKAFYTVTPYKGSEFLCSKPLSDLSKDRNEKTKLWSVLKKFVQ